MDIIINKNALDILAEVMNKRNWHQGKIKRNVASEYKRNLKINKVSYERACELLVMIGYTKIQDESWTLNK